MSNFREIFQSSDRWTDKPKNWDDVVKNAMAIFNHRDRFTYCLSGDGQLADLYGNNYNYYKDHNKNQSFEDWINKVARGKYVLDCGGYITAIAGLNIYLTSGDLRNKGLKKTAPENGVAGSLLWKPGHVGIDIGYGYFLHFPAYGRTCEFGKISQYDWQESYRLPGIDYAGADAR